VEKVEEVEEVGKVPREVVDDLSTPLLDKMVSYLAGHAATCGLLDLDALVDLIKKTQCLAYTMLQSQWKGVAIGRTVYKRSNQHPVHPLDSDRKTGLWEKYDMIKLPGAFNSGYTAALAAASKEESSIVITLLLSEEQYNEP
jgi:hypothetical protein